MQFDTRYSHHPDDVRGYDGAALRKHFLVERVFVPGAISLAYAHDDRVIFGGAAPTSAPLALEGAKELGTERFLDRRELGLINVGGPGSVTVDGERRPVGARDGMYVGKGAKSVAFESADPAAPAKFYLMSCPAHRSLPTALIPKEKANPRRLGSAETCNVRTINQYVHPAVCESCQLVMGMTVLEPGSVWNSWPPHTHERRMEVYLYFDMAEATRVFHFMGRPDETRHIAMSNEQAVISPSWSVHYGVGTGAYTFIWGMAGENQTFDDMDNLAPAAIR
ncbi:MAG TPA: 5-dehydro-4-deoxy-D-glucuronate isomerase [Spirochaetales bacterium]|nr:5-dehydro-4-deoxy-D-glucuronate isomerase [Spirochaetales bacterium]HRY53564.1 5-dehydro-4-deoxy-D-glucuronate isomerase [Spirochaetia bacterium]HRZ63384.1 5-dehydro-4-deoxy-D-glucuronate isomerase [Spirochaetia bacterium]